MRRKLEWTTIIFLVLLGTAFCEEEEDEEKQSEKSPKLISAFQVVQFPNDFCSGNDNKNGTCYTSEECDSRGGKGSGSCAEGYGVCCTFTKDCGEESAENNTYWEPDDIPTSGCCHLKICKMNENICQLRLDFDTFVIAGPSTLTLSVYLQSGGNPSSAGAKAGSTATMCLTDMFTISSDPGLSVPGVCGTLTGEHMYVSASEMCNTMNFKLGSGVFGISALPQRNWKIRVTQFECTYNNLAPQGCTQYFYGGTSGTVKSFNFDGGVHLAEQNQKICIRREKNICRVCFSTAADLDFALSGMIAKGLIGAASDCCGYGVDGVATTGFDCVVIPGAHKKTDGLVVGSQICGADKGLNTAAAGMTSASVCTKQLPFMIELRTDSFEMPGAAAEKSLGFKLSYELLTACTG